MKIIICGTLVPVEFEDKISQLSNAANRFLLNFVRVLSKENDVQVYSYLGINVDSNVEVDLERLDSNVRFYFKSKKRICCISDYAKDVIRAIKKADCVITYNVVYAWLFVPMYARKLNKKSILILADYSPKESYGNVLRKVYAEIQLAKIRKYDMVIGLSEKTQKYVTDKQKFICIEGGISREVFEYFGKEELRNDDLLKYMYAGILEPVTGIDLLLKAFVQNEEQKIRLYISGKGSLEKLVQSYASKDSRIIFLGCLPYEEYLCNLKQADILINPRNMNLLENENNFPSKIMEYLATGKPIISTKFPGWEKFQHVITFCESTVEDIENAISKVKKQESPNGKKERRVFASRYLWEKQINKLLSEF